jgi:hypothetical protein
MSFFQQTMYEVISSVKGKENPKIISPHLFWYANILEQFTLIQFTGAVWNNTQHSLESGDFGLLPQSIVLAMWPQKKEFKTVIQFFLFEAIKLHKNVIFVIPSFLNLAYLPSHDDLQFHPFFCKWHFILHYWIILPCIQYHIFFIQSSFVGHIGWFYCKQCCYKHGCAGICMVCWSAFLLKETEQCQVFLFPCILAIICYKLSWWLTS